MGDGMNAARWWGLLALVAMTGCTSVRLESRDGCWLRQTEKWGRVTEKIGPCLKEQTQWVGDRPTRLVQECVADASWRWYNNALAAWQRGEPFDASPPADATLLDACQAEVARMLTQQNESLQERVAALEVDRERALSHNERLADVLGEAAIKPAGTATATASADGRSTSTHDARSSHQADLSAQTPASATQPIVVPYAPSEKIVVRYSPKPKNQEGRFGAKTADKSAVTQVAAETAPSNPESLVCEPNPAPAACECACDDSTKP